MNTTVIEKSVAVTKFSREAFKERFGGEYDDDEWFATSDLEEIFYMDGDLETVMQELVDEGRNSYDYMIGLVDDVMYFASRL